MDLYRFRHPARGYDRPRYMILQRNEEEVGLFSDVIMFLVAIDTVKNWGYIPIIDLKNCPRANLQIKDVYGKENAWEYFFEQPEGISLEMITDSMEVSYCPNEIFYGYDCCYMMRQCTKNKQYAEYWKQALKKYIHLNSETLQNLNETYLELFHVNDRNLGLAIREGYVKALASKIPASSMEQHVGTVDDFIQDTYKLLNEDEGIAKIFITCEFQSTIDKFQKVFGKEKVIFINKWRYQDSDEYYYGQADLSASQHYDRINRKQIALDYLKEMYLLSKCDSMLYTENSGSIFAYWAKEGDYTHLVPVSRIAETLFSG